MRTQRTYTIGRERLGLVRRFYAYHLETNLYVLVALFALGALAVLMYYRSADASGFTANLWLAFATSLMASILVLLAETYVKFRSHQDDLFLEGIEKLGISNLHFDKQALLSELLEECHDVFWAVGYRFIVTAQLSRAIEEAARHPDVRMRFLIVPSWSDSFRLVYGDHERVADNYLSVLRAVHRGTSGEPEGRIEVRFVDRPIFNDTYRVDRAVVTGPYMHNEDPRHGKLAANDFFTYELHTSSRLHGLVVEEFEVLWNAADAVLDWDRFEEMCEQIDRADLNDTEKLGLLRQACRSR